MAKKFNHRALAYAKPRDANGRFQPMTKLVLRQPIDWNVLYQFRDDWRSYRTLVANAKREERWSGLRSIAIFTTMSAVLVGMLVAGVMGGA